MGAPLAPHQKRGTRCLLQWKSLSALLLQPQKEFYQKINKCGVVRKCTIDIVIMVELPNMDTPIVRPLLTRFQFYNKTWTPSSVGNEMEMSINVYNHTSLHFFTFWLYERLRCFCLCTLNIKRSKLSYFIQRKSAIIFRSSRIDKNLSKYLAWTRMLTQPETPVLSYRKCRHCKNCISSGSESYIYF